MFQVADAENLIGIIKGVKPKIGQFRPRYYNEKRRILWNFLECDTKKET